MKKYIWMVICFFILLYFGPSLIAPVTGRECKEAAVALQLYQQGSWAVKTLDRTLAGAALHALGNNPFGLRVGNVLVVALMSFLGLFAIKKCINDTMTGLMSSLIFFTSFWCFYSPVVPQSTVFGEFFNVLALGAFFMASRENRYSIQRIGLLILCGFMTVLSLLMNGISPFVISFVIAVIFLLVEEKYIDMLLMPIVISTVTIGFLLLHGYYVHGSWCYELQVLFKGFVSDFNMMRSSFSFCRVLENLKMLLIGIVPSLVFLVCAIRGYKGYWKHFFRQSIYRFTLIFLIVSTGSVMLNNEFLLADLPLTYLPYSFLVGAGFVNYMRTRNRFMLFGVLNFLFAALIMTAAVWHWFAPVMALPETFAFAGILWSGFIFLGLFSRRTSSRMKAYFLGLSVGLFAAMTAASYKEINSYELHSVFNIAVEPENGMYEIYAAPGMYDIVRFYMPQYEIKAVKLDENGTIQSLPDEMKDTLKEKDVIIFAKNDELGSVLMKKARTLVHEKFKLHLFTVEK